MGIKGLFEFLKKKNFLEGAYVNIPLREFKKISIDGHSWLIKNLSITRKEVLYTMPDPTKEIDYEMIFIKLTEKFINTNSTFLDHNVIPVWTWDGKNKPAKADTLKKRKEEMDKKIEKANELLKIIEEKRKENMFADREDYDKYRDRLADIHETNKLDLQRMKDLAKKIGIPTSDADGEGEQECANHVIHGMCDAVMSSDGDVLALGCKILVKKLSFFEKEMVCESYLLHKILQNMGYDYPMFKEFCIMCGTDFNTNIYKLGPAKAYEYIKKYKTIEKFAEMEKKCIECLKVPLVRSLLTLPDKNYDEKDFVLGDLDEECIKFLDENITRRYKMMHIKNKN